MTQGKIYLTKSRRREDRKELIRGIIPSAAFMLGTAVTLVVILFGCAG